MYMQLGVFSLKNDSHLCIKMKLGCRIRIRIWITTKIELFLPYSIPKACTKFHANPFSIFFVVNLFTDRQTERQTDRQTYRITDRQIDRYTQHKTLALQTKPRNCEKNKDKITSSHLPGDGYEFHAEP